MRRGRNILFSLSSNPVLLLALLVTFVYADILPKHVNCDVQSSLDAGKHSTDMVQNALRQGPGDSSGVTMNVFAYPQVPLNSEGYQRAPDSLELEQVHVYVRHGAWLPATTESKRPANNVAGERTPVGVRLAGPPASIPEHWNFCWAARGFRAAVLSNASFAARSNAQEYDFALENAGGARKLVERKDGTHVGGEW